MVHGNIGKKRTIEFKNNLSKKNSGEGNPFFGMHHSIKSKEKIGPKKGSIPWNKNLRGEEYKKHYSNGFNGGVKIGNIPWDKGLIMENNKSLKQMSKSKKKFYQEYPKKHANYIMAQNGFVSKPQKQLYNIIKKLFLNEHIEQEYPIKCINSTKFLDVTINDLKLDFEYDGERFHSTKEQKESDKLRDLELTGYGWTILRYNKDNLNELNIINDLKNVGVFL